jgi:hypothetical protein
VCDEPNFDVASRNLFCSGSLSSEHVANVTGLTDNFESGPLVDVTPDWMAVAHVASVLKPAGLFDVQVDLRPQEGASFGAAVVGSYSVPGTSAALADISLFGQVRSAGANPVVAAIHADRKSVSFMNVNGTGASVANRPSGADSLDAVGTDARNLFNKMDSCVGDRALITDLAAFPSPGHPDNDYLLVATRCGMVVVGMSQSFSQPEVLVEVPLDAEAVHIDEARERVVIASGRDGLRVREFGDIKSKADEVYDSYEFVMDHEPVDCELIELCPSGAESLSRQVDAAVTDTELAKVAAVNVTHVELSGDRLYYINEATNLGGADSNTYLISARLAESNTADQFQAIALSDDDRADQGEGKVVSYTVVALDGGLVAVLRAVRTPGVDGEKDTRSSSLRLFDAPENHPPTLAVEVPTLQPVDSIARSGSQLLVVDDDAVTAYTFEVGGELL